MPGRFPYEKMSSYPHLGPHDAAIWDHFIDHFPDEYLAVDYDAWVGEGSMPDPKAEGDPGKHTGEGLTKKRIDVVAYRADGSIDCIELRPHAGSSAIGAVLTNHFLLQGADTSSPCTPLIITDKAQPDLAGIAAKHGVKIIELGFA